MPRFLIDVLHGVSQAGTGNGRYLKPADMLIRASQVATGLQQTIHFAHASCDFEVSHLSYMVASFLASQQASQVVFLANSTSGGLLLLAMLLASPKGTRGWAKHGGSKRKITKMSTFQQGF